MGAPVDDAAALINQALFVQRDKHLTHGLGAPLIHGEPGAVPIAAGAQLLLLLHNAVAVLLLPGPYPLQEFFPAQVVAGQPLLHPQLLFHLDLRGNAGMIDAGNPQGVIALHPLEANQRILHGRIHGVTHMQLAGNVGRGHNDGKGLFALVPLRVEKAALLPHIVDKGLHVLRLIHLW